MPSPARQYSALARPDQLNPSVLNAMPFAQVQSRESLKATISTFPRSLIENLLVEAVMVYPELGRSFQSYFQNYVLNAREATHTPPNQLQQRQLQMTHSGEQLAPSAASASVEHSTKKRANAGDVKKPAAKRAKVQKPLNFHKIERIAWNLINKSTGWAKAEDGIDKIIEKVMVEVGIVKNLEVYHTALVSLGDILDMIFHSELSRKKARQLRSGSAPPNLTKAMMKIVSGMDEHERNAFISSAEGGEWERKVNDAEAYMGGQFGTGPQVHELMELFPENEEEEEEEEEA